MIEASVALTDNNFPQGKSQGSSSLFFFVCGFKYFVFLEPHLQKCLTRSIRRNITGSVMFLYCICCGCLKYSQNSQKLLVLIVLKMSETKLFSTLHCSLNDVHSAVVSEVALSEVEFYRYKICLFFCLFVSS